MLPCFVETRDTTSMTILFMEMFIRLTREPPIYSECVPCTNILHMKHHTLPSVYWTRYGKSGISVSIPESTAGFFLKDIFKHRVLNIYYSSPFSKESWIKKVFQCLSKEVSPALPGFQSVMRHLANCLGLQSLSSWQSGEDTPLPQSCYAKAKKAFISARSQYHKLILQ